MNVLCQTASPATAGTSPISPNGWRRGGAFPLTRISRPRPLGVRSGLAQLRPDAYLKRHRPLLIANHVHVSSSRQLAGGLLGMGLAGLRPTASPASSSTHRPRRRARRDTKRQFSTSSAPTGRSRWPRARQALRQSLRAWRARTPPGGSDSRGDVKQRAMEGRLHYDGTSTIVKPLLSKQWQDPGSRAAFAACSDVPELCRARSDLRSAERNGLDAAWPRRSPTSSTGRWPDVGHVQTLENRDPRYPR